MSTRRGRGRGRRPQPAVAMPANPATTTRNSHRGAANQRQGGLRATLTETSAASAGSKRRDSSRGSHPFGRNTKRPRQDNNAGGSFLTRDDIPAIIEAVRDATRLDRDARSTPPHSSTSMPPTTAEEIQQQELLKHTS